MEDPRKVGGRDAGGSIGRRLLRAVAIRLWFLVVVGVIPAAASVALNVLLVRFGFLEGIAPWQLLLGFALLAYGVYGVRDRLPLWSLVADDPAYRRRQVRRHAAQILRITRRALRRPWYRRRVAPPAANEIEAAADALTVALKVRGGGEPESLHGALDRLDRLFDRHLGFMKVSVYVEYAGQIGLAVLVAFVLRESLVEAFKIPSGSMLPTLELGDHIFVNKLQYGIRMPFTGWTPVEYAEPRRGDVIVFTEAGKGGDDFIKRVVGIPGDRVRVEEDGTLAINGRTVPRCPAGVVRAPLRDEPGSPLGLFDAFVESLGGARYAIRQIHDARGVAGGTAYRHGTVAYPGPAMGRPFPMRPLHRCPEGRDPDPQGCVVPAGHVFVMGDNRDNSNDSRFWGAVPFERIKGKAMFIWWSNADESVETERIGIGIHDGVEVFGPELTDAARRCLRDLENQPPGSQ
ncbi:MAG: signal peptidase I [Myxococcota bacterium]|nr:signal peptidase I [Myxococcota bacterium]